jgi:hypothetical protein
VLHEIVGADAKSLAGRTLEAGGRDPRDAERRRALPGQRHRADEMKEHLRGLGYIE